MTDPIILKFPAPPGQTAGDICTREVLTVTPNTPVSEALKLLGARNWGRLPVVDAHNPQKVVGILRRHDIVRAYDLAMQHKQEAAQRARAKI